ncbi:DUF4168 domain-containing protein [Leptolyngbya sp. CCNP1308]|uniref:DUF4168 domain-containing protein n=1 Tax=Leptolyngbya sp. CCNP1308 TaxID=3110255 RepID=UPI002B21C15C|nr:DUF4168 domain-containing protein [Leptolyngbya sp. CCNP1308]MEA5452982.1 DUF4168 domain-containing protein [Leptolyngbya sp. CCNP1308]
MVRFCIAALLIMLAWLTPGAAWASSSSPLLAQTTVVEVAEVDANAPISDADIDTFAKVYQQVQTLRLQAEQEMAKAVEDEGLTIERFNAIAATQLDGAADSPDDMAKIAEKAKISKKEDKKFKAAVDRIIAIRQSTEGDMEKAIEADGLSVDTFNSILERSADDTALQRQISDAIVKQTLANVEPAS